MAVFTAPARSLQGPVCARPRDGRGGAGRRPRVGAHTVAGGGGALARLHQVPSRLVRLCCVPCAPASPARCWTFVRGGRRLVLDSNTERRQAHRFYHAHGLTIRSFHFAKDLSVTSS